MDEGRRREGRKGGGEEKERRGEVGREGRGKEKRRERGEGKRKKKGERVGKESWERGKSMEIWKRGRKEGVGRTRREGHNSHGKTHVRCDHLKKDTCSSGWAPGLPGLGHIGLLGFFLEGVGAGEREKTLLELGLGRLAWASALKILPAFFPPP